MMIARWQIDARFGHKQDAINALKSWAAEFGSQIGWTPDRLRITTGSIGAPESRIISEVEIANLAELNASWEKLASLPGHAEWSKQLEPHIVSGSNVWEVYRIV